MSDVNDKHTVSMYFVDSAVRQLTSSTRSQVLVQAGISEQLIGNELARVPSTAFSALWLAVAQELDDEFFGLDTRSMKVGSFALAAQSAISCENIDRAIKHLLRAFRVFLDDIHGNLALRKGEAVLQISNRIKANDDRRFADETFLVLLYGLMCWLAGKRIPLHKVCFAHASTQQVREYNLMFCDTVEFNTSQTSLHFDANFLDVPVVQSYSTLKQFLVSAPQSVFLKYRNNTSWTAQVRRQLRTSVNQSMGWLTFSEIAKTLKTTESTLRRRLEVDGNSFQSIKDALRNDLAIDYLCNSRQSIEEIALALGLHDASAFHRAFKRWNGIQPGEYRKLKGKISN